MQKSRAKHKRFDWLRIPFLFVFVSIFAFEYWVCGLSVSFSDILYKMWVDFIFHKMKYIFRNSVQKRVGGECLALFGVDVYGNDGRKREAKKSLLHLTKHYNKSCANLYRVVLIKLKEIREYNSFSLLCPALLFTSIYSLSLSCPFRIHHLDRLISSILFVPKHCSEFLYF